MAGAKLFVILFFAVMLIVLASIGVVVRLAGHSMILPQHLCKRLGKKILRTSSSPALLTQVVIRVRPPLPREVEGERMFQNIVSVDKEEHVITISENLNAVLDEVGG